MNKLIILLVVILGTLFSCTKEKTHHGTPSSRALKSLHPDYKGNWHSDMYFDSTRYLYFTDSRDGNRYKFIKIGKLYWMADNLRYKPNGYSIYSDPVMIKKYGYLYPKGVGSCPQGWRLPNGKDLDDLVAAVKEKPIELLSLDVFPPDSTIKDYYGDSFQKYSGTNKSGFDLKTFGYTYKAYSYNNPQNIYTIRKSDVTISSTDKILSIDTRRFSSLASYSPPSYFGTVNTKFNDYPNQNNPVVSYDFMFNCRCVKDSI